MKQSQKEKFLVCTSGDIISGDNRSWNIVIPEDLFVARVDRFPALVILLPV